MNQRRQARALRVEPAGTAAQNRLRARGLRVRDFRGDMFCAHCGEPILGESSFCDGCGTQISATVPGTSAEPAGPLQRVRRILITPSAAWPLIASEPASPRDLYAGYVAPLAAIAVAASLVGRTLVGSPADRIAAALVHAALAYALCFLGVFLVALIVDLLAPSFAGRRDALAALKLTVYGFTPGWLAGVFNIVPALSVLVLLGPLYALYVIYLGLPVLMRCPPAKAAGYAVAVVLCAIATWALFAVLALWGTAGIGRMAGEVARRMGA